MVFATHITNNGLIAKDLFTNHYEKNKQIEEQGKDMNRHFKRRENMKTIWIYEKMFNFLSNEEKCKFITEEIYFISHRPGKKLESGNTKVGENVE